MEKHCVSLELAKEIKEAGWNKKTEFRWYPEVLVENEVRIEDNIFEVSPLAVGGSWYISNDKREMLRLYYYAPLGTEIIEELPNIINPIDDNCRGHCLSISPSVSIKGWQVCYEGYRAKVFIDKSLPNALAKTWIYLKKEGLLK